MTTRNKILLAALLFALPLVFQAVRFYRIPAARAGFATPDYQSFTIPEPPAPSAKAEETIAPAAGQVIVFDAGHGNNFSLNELQPFSQALARRGARVEMYTGAMELASHLKYASAFIVFSPNYAFSAEESLAVHQFVASGGRLLVFTDPTRGITGFDFMTGNAIQYPDVNAANLLLAPYEISVSNDYIYNLKDNEGNFRNIKVSDFADHPLVDGLGTVVFYGAHSLRTISGLELALANDGSVSSLTDQGDALAGLVLAKNGNVLVGGDFSFMFDPLNQAADNAALLGRVADFALTGSREVSLANFPYVFKGKVALVMAGKAQFNASLLSPIAYLQSSLKLTNVELATSEKLVKGDMILIGTLSEDEILLPYFKKFGVEFEPGSDYLELAGFGKVGASGNGILLFNRGPEANTLVLLAESTEDLPSLIYLVAEGNLSSCVIQGDVGVCSVGYGGSFEGEQDYTEEEPTPSG
jgi:hypothetical protein